MNKGKILCPCIFKNKFKSSGNVVLFKLTVMIIFILTGCNAIDEKSGVEKVIISDTAADVLLMDVQGLEDLDNIDSLIKELSLIIEEESEALVIESLGVDSEKTVENKDLTVVSDNSKEEDSSNATDNYSTFVGKVIGVSNNKIFVEVVQIKRIDPKRLEKMTPREKREFVDSSITHTGKSIIVNVTEDTLIRLQNGSEIKLFNIKKNQLVSIIIDEKNNGKVIKLIRLLRKPNQ